jgi:hypothetical protein
MDRCGGLGLGHRNDAIEAAAQLCARGDTAITNQMHRSILRHISPSLSLTRVSTRLVNQRAAQLSADERDCVPRLSLPSLKTVDGPTVLNPAAGVVL